MSRILSYRNVKTGSIVKIEGDKKKQPVVKNGMVIATGGTSFSDGLVRISKTAFSAFYRRV